MNNLGNVKAFVKRDGRVEVNKKIEDKINKLKIKDKKVKK